MSRKCGQLSKGYGKAPVNETYAGGTIFVDHASGYILVEHQISLHAPDTIISKRNFERIMYDKGVLIKMYQLDNGVFLSSEFENVIKRENQTITYSSVGASHQNGVAERAIRAVIEQARTMLIHAVIRNPDNIDATLWPFAMTRLEYIWNVTPNEGTDLPNTILSKKLQNEEYAQVCSLKI